MTLRFLSGLLPGALLLVVGCSDDGTRPGGRVVAGVDFDELFAPASGAEVAAITADWSTRDVSPQGFRVEATATIPLGSAPASLRIVSHVVDGARHYGAIVIPAGAGPASLPALVYAHGGDQGLDLDELLLLTVFLPEVSDEFVYVVPSYRSEPLSYESSTWVSEGAPSPWDRDVDDALALLNVALQTTPEARSDRIGVVGFSRGAAVGMLMAARDPRIDVVVEFFGPTDFFGSFVQDITEEALLGSLRDLPGLSYLNDMFIQPLKNGQLTIQDVRPELVRRSSVLFVERLPQLQLHHGTADEVVDVSQAESLIRAMQAAGHSAPDFEHYLYPGGGHNPLTLFGSISRTEAFVSRLVP